MKIILSILINVSTLVVAAQSTDIFYKTIDSKEAKDSILEKLKSENSEYIEFSKPCYWETRDSFNIDYCDSYLLIYQDSNETYHSILVTEFFIFQQESKEHRVFEYFRWNRSELFETQLRPNEHDLIRRPVDTAIMLYLGYQLGDTLSFNDSLMLTSIGPGYEHYTGARDGLPNQTITISSDDASRRIVIDQYVLSPSNHYYRYNCKKPIYTLRILLQQEFEDLQGSVEYHLENKELGLLDSLGRLDFESNTDYYEQIYEEQIDYWINLVKHDIGKNWELNKNNKSGINKK